jgi:hypothetical protein
MRPARVLLLAVPLLGACVSLGSHLLPGTSTEDEVVHALGAPAMQWTESDGSHQLVFPRGPMGVQTYVARFGPDRKLVTLDNVLTEAHFARIRQDMTEDEVLRLLGPSVPAWTIHFPARDELAREWRYCDDWHQLARFSVLFDASRRTVRSTLSQREDQLGECGSNGGCWCSR